MKRQVFLAFGLSAVSALSLSAGAYATPDGASDSPACVSINAQVNALAGVADKSGVKASHLMGHNYVVAHEKSNHDFIALHRVVVANPECFSREDVASSHESLQELGSPA